MAQIVFLHGLESRVDTHFIPNGGKARHLAQNYDVTLAPLDTRVAQACARRLGASGFRHPFAEEEACFATPMQRARDSLSADTQLVIGSSFGGAVLLKLLHEGSWSGPSLFLAGAGVKLTPHDTLPPGVPCHLVHGLQDTVVPWSDSQQLAHSSDTATLSLVEDGHRLAEWAPLGLDACIHRLAAFLQSGCNHSRLMTS